MTSQRPRPRPPFQMVELGLEAIRRIQGLLCKVRRQDPNLADQLRRALTSASLLAAEGNRARKNNRVAKLQAAGAEASEAETALRIAVAWGYLDEEEIRDGLDALDHFQAIARRLTR